MTHRLLIDGRFVDGARTLDVIDPTRRGLRPVTARRRHAG